MKITIITICLNDLKGLKKTRESVLAQIGRDYEHIIIDGGSTDGTQEYLAECSDEGLRWISESDNGRSDAFNKGIKMAEDSLILCLNAGDVFYDKNVIADVLADWEKSGVDVLSYPVVRDDGCVMNVSEDNWEKGLNCHQGIFIRKAIYSKIGGYNLFYENRMDYDFFYRLAKAKVSHKIMDRIVAVFDNNGISTYNRNNAMLEGAAIKLTYDKTKYLDEAIRELNTVKKSIEDNSDIQNESIGIIENSDVGKKKLLIQWLYNTQKGKRISEYFDKQGFKKISIYGCGEIGRLIAGEASKAVIQEFIDRRADSIHMDKYSVVTIEDMNTDIDAVIISLVMGEKKIENDLRRRFSGEIITIKEIVKQIS